MRVSVQEYRTTQHTLRTHSCRRFVGRARKATRGGGGLPGAPGAVRTGAETAPHGDHPVGNSARMRATTTVSQGRSQTKATMGLSSTNAHALSTPEPVSGRLAVPALVIHRLEVVRMSPEIGSGAVYKYWCCSS